TANVNRGNLSLPTGAVLTLGSGATLANFGGIAMTGGLLTGSGTFFNRSAGTLSGTGTIQTPLSNEGALAVGAGTLSVSPAFTTSGGIQLAAINANLTGGASTNTGTIQGFGNLGNAVTNTGTIQPVGGTLFLTGTVLNPTGGLVRVPASGEALIT